MKTVLRLLLVLFVGVTGADTTYKRSDYVTNSGLSRARKVVLSAHVRANGTWACTYTGRIFKSADSLDIDHIVPLHYAAQNGLADSSSTLRHTFGVDTTNLTQVNARVNRSKGDKGPSSFMPTVNKCLYARRWLLVTARYGIHIQAQDSAVLAKLLRYCH